MKTKSFTIKASLIASMILSGQAFAQTLPDEINHTHYLRIYQNLEQILSDKTAEFDKLASEKNKLESKVAEMEKAKSEIPARNNELQRTINFNRQEIARINGEIQGLEGVLGQIIQDLDRLDNIIGQLQRDIDVESSRSQQIQMRRNQVALDVANINNRFQREVHQENQSEKILSRLAKEHNEAQESRQSLERESRQLTKEVERFKVEINPTKKAIAQNNATLATKRAEQTNLQAKLPEVRSEIIAAEAKLSNAEAGIAPKRAQLNTLIAELAAATPNLATLQNENKVLAAKVKANVAKIEALDVNSLISRRGDIETAVTADKAKIQANVNAISKIEESTKPVEDQIDTLTAELRTAQRDRNLQEVARLKKKIDNLSDSIAKQNKEIAQLKKENEKINATVTVRQNEIAKLNDTIVKANEQISALKAEYVVANVKITENDKKIAEINRSTAGLQKQIAQLTQEVEDLQTQKEPLTKKVAALKQQEAQINSQIAAATSGIQALENEVKKLSAQIAEMEKNIAEYPQSIRRMENQMRQLDEKIAQTRSELQREQLLLGRIRQDRQAVENELIRAHTVLGQISQDLEGSERLIGALSAKLNEEARNRDALTRYNQDSLRKLEPLRSQKAFAEKEVAGASDEVRINDQDMATLNRELPVLYADLRELNPQVATAENAKMKASDNANNANSQYQNRFSLYQNYLAEAQALGASKAALGATDGAKAGAVEAKVKAAKIASENALAEGKWEALRRGYIRGEIAGYSSGFEIGRSSESDAQQGEVDGRIAGLRRAKDHSNLVIKPEIYLEELERRLKEDQTTSKSKLTAAITKELPMIKAMMAELENTVDDLSQSEINEAARIISSLDALIAQSEIEIAGILKLRKQLSDARNVYSTPGAGENAHKVDCSTVYKGVKEFSEACSGSYVIRYQHLYNASHADAFTREYAGSFKQQLDVVFENELSRLYSGYLKEASVVGKEVGISSGKQDVYQKNFDLAENAAYNNQLPVEAARVELEAEKLVQEHLSQNAALTLKGNGKLSTASAYGIAPGADADLSMAIKNIGSKASQGNSLVKITELSSNLSVDRRDAPLTAVAANAHADLNVLKVKVSDAAIPGTRAVIAGQIVHPGNHYRSSRIENFRIESVLGVNPSAESSVAYNSSPNITTLFVTNKHNFSITVRPKHSGVNSGYETSLEEVGSSYIEMVARPGSTGVLSRGSSQTLTYTYKVNKAAKGRTLTLKVTIRNAGKVISTQSVQIRPQ